MNNEQKIKRIEELIEVLHIQFIHRPSWGDEPRVNTLWGSKTKMGLIATISRIVYEEDWDE